MYISDQGDIGSKLEADELVTQTGTIKDDLQALPTGDGEVVVKNADKTNVTISFTVKNSSRLSSRYHGILTRSSATFQATHAHAIGTIKSNIDTSVATMLTAKLSGLWHLMATPLEFAAHALGGDGIAVTDQTKLQETLKSRAFKQAVTKPGDIGFKALLPASGVEELDATYGQLSGLAEALLKVSVAVEFQDGKTVSKQCIFEQHWEDLWLNWVGLGFFEVEKLTEFFPAATGDVVTAVATSLASQWHRHAVSFLREVAALHKWFMTIAKKSSDAKKQSIEWPASVPELDKDLETLQLRARYCIDILDATSSFISLPSGLPSECLQELVHLQGMVSLAHGKQKLSDALKVKSNEPKHGVNKTIAFSEWIADLLKIFEATTAKEGHRVHTALEEEIRVTRALFNTMFGGFVVKAKLLAKEAEQVAKKPELSMEAEYHPTFNTTELLKIVAGDVVPDFSLFISFSFYLFHSSFFFSFPFSFLSFSIFHVS